MILLNFSHPITPAQQSQIETLLGKPIERIEQIKSQFDDTQPFGGQLKELSSSIPLTAEELQTAPILVNLPALNFIAGMLLAELHGRMGYFPPVLRLRRLPDVLPPQYEIAEILNLQAIREEARKAR